MTPALRLQAVLFVALCAAAAAGCGGPPRGAAQKGAAAAGTPPAVSAGFADVAGIQAELARHRGRPVLLNFWATWCGPCVEELPDLAKLAQEFGARGPDFVGVSLDGWVFGSDAEAEKKVREALADSGVRYVNLIYRGDQDPLLEGFKLPGPIPYSILYDRDGHKVKDWAGRLDAKDLRQAVSSLP